MAASRTQRFAEATVRHLTGVDRVSAGIEQAIADQMRRTESALTRLLLRDAPFAKLNQSTMRFHARELREQLVRVILTEQQWQINSLTRTLGKQAVADLRPLTQTQARKLVQGIRFEGKTIDAHFRRLAKVRNALTKKALKGAANKAAAIRSLQRGRGQQAAWAYVRRLSHGVTQGAVTAATSSARTQLYQRIPQHVQRERYVAVLDDRTTLTCISLDNTIHPVGLGPMPPLHFRCRSMRTPVFKGDAPPELPTWDKFLRRQDAVFQDKVLGKTGGRLYRANPELHVRDFTTAGGRPLKVPEMLRKVQRILDDSPVVATPRAPGITPASPPRRRAVPRDWPEQGTTRQVFQSHRAAAFEQRFDIWHRVLSPGERSAFINFGSTGSPRINTALRTGQALKGRTLQQVRRMDAAMQRAPTFKPELVYRGTRLPGNPQVGDTLTLPSYQSTSLSPHVALRNVGSEVADSVMLEIRTNRGVWLGRLSDKADELELLLPRNAQYRVVGRRVVDYGGRKVETVMLELVDDTVPAAQPAAQATARAAPLTGAERRRQLLDQVDERFRDNPDWGSNRTARNMRRDPETADLRWDVGEGAFDKRNSPEWRAYLRNQRQHLDDFVEQRGMVSTDEMFAFYTDSGYDDINELLRAAVYRGYEDEAFVRSQAKLLEDFLGGTNPLPETTVLYRGIQGDYAAQVAALNVGEEFVDAAFMSTSPDLATAAGFDGETLMRVFVPAGRGKGFYLEPFSGNPGELEFMMQRGARMRILDKVKVVDETGRTRWYLDVELVGFD